MDKKNQNEIEVRHCAYCHAIRSKDEMELKEIYVNHHWKKDWYCADKPCADHAQFAAEG